MNYERDHANRPLPDWLDKRRRECAEAADEIIREKSPLADNYPIGEREEFMALVLKAARIQRKAWLAEELEDTDRRERGF